MYRQRSPYLSFSDTSLILKRDHDAFLCSIATRGKSSLLGEMGGHQRLSECHYLQKRAASDSHVLVAER